MSMPHFNSGLVILTLFFGVTGCFAIPEQGNLDPPTNLLADARQQQLPVWSIGDHWIYDDGYDLTVTEQQGSITHFTRNDEKNRWIKRHGFLTVASFDNAVERKMISISVSPDDFQPLEIGKTLLFTKYYKAGELERIHHNSWIVEGQEQITVPAGKFMCWVILFTSRSTTSSWRSFERWWYSPQVHHYVQLEYQYGNNPLAIRRLTHYFPGS